MIKMASKAQCTVVIIGDTKTGKTALIQRLTNDKFLEVRTKLFWEFLLAWTKLRLLDSTLVHVVLMFCQCYFLDFRFFYKPGNSVAKNNTIWTQIEKQSSSVITIMIVKEFTATTNTIYWSQLTSLKVIFVVHWLQ